MVKNNFKFLLVQGRTLPQIGEQLQYFPNNWKEEFPLIRKLGFSGIEWIYDVFSENFNPIMNTSGRDEIFELSNQYNVNLENIVFDWFMTYPLLTNEGLSINDKIKKLKTLIHISSELKFKRIIFPILEKNNIATKSKQEKFIKIFREQVLDELNSYNIEINLETSLTGNEELFVLEQLNHDKVKLCFDMGNSASYGYEPYETISKISPYLSSVHIKDRERNGGSVPLGTGNVEFKQVFQALKDTKFNGPISFQVFRNKNSDNVKVLQNAFTFINSVMNKVSVE